MEGAEKAGKCIWDNWISFTNIAAKRTEEYSKDLSASWLANTNPLSSSNHPESSS
jgi:hypothetical protein